MAHPNRIERVTYSTTRNGYEIWTDSITAKTVRVHQLVAIANGADPRKIFSGGEWNVHHKNRIPWDNRPENLEVMTSSDHKKLHAEDWALDIDRESLKKLRWDRSMSHSEIAEELGCDVRTVGKKLKREKLHWTNREL